MSSSTPTLQQPLSVGEKNKLHARLLKAEMLGNDKLVNDLKDQLEYYKKIEEDAKKTQPPPSSSTLSADEKNKIHAKIIKAEMLGNHDLVKKLKEQLERADDSTPSAKPSETSETSSNPSSSKEYHAKEQTKVLTVEKRVDEDSLSVKQLYRREKAISRFKDSIMFVSESAKNIGKDGYSVDDEYDIERKVKKHKSDVIIREETEEETSCSNCLSSWPQDIVMSRGKSVFLSLTRDEPLVEGHCIIRSSLHNCDLTCLLEAEEDVLIEINLLKGRLVDYFREQKKSVIFTETSTRRRRRYDPHLMIECIPINESYIDEARMYFKKAIMESETEWSDNKKLVEIKDRPVSKCLPKGLSYFWATFGLRDSGYGHVIEDEERFPSFFAHEVIGGILDIEPRRWRKPRKDWRRSQSQLSQIKLAWRKVDPFSHS